MSPTEIRLWRVLQTRPEGLLFRKQHPFGPFVFDFWCKSAAVAVEVDGLAHDFERTAEADLKRDQWAQDQGIETIRVAANDVRTNLEGAVTHIDQPLPGKNPSTALRAVPLPAKSRGG